ncbi:hypothetical protein QQP08_010831 [Theobroma cacao]|nr:hypothetical protein QQP08_010831 [Theobroma cacao]
MERPSVEEEVTDDQKLHHLFKNLEQEWDFIKQRPERTLHTRSTGSSKMIQTLRLLNNSPRKLMSSLQHRSSPSERVAWKVRTNDLAVEEILTERRAAIESGKLKGRRLFEGAEGVTEMGFGRDEVTCSGWEIGLDQESEVRSVFSYESDNDVDEIWGRKEVSSASCPRCCSCSPSSSSSSLCAEKEQRGGTEVATLAEKRIVRDVGSGRGRRWMVIIVWLTITLAVCVVGIISRRNFCLYEDEEVCLTPT